HGGAGHPKAARNRPARMRPDAAKATGRPDHWRVADTDRLAADVTALPAAGPAAAARWRGCLVRRARAEILEGPGKAAGRLAELTRAAADARAVWGDRHPETARCEVELARAALAAANPVDPDKALHRAPPVR